MPRPKSPAVVEEDNVDLTNPVNRIADVGLPAGRSSKKVDVGGITIPRIEPAAFDIDIVGDTPLVVNSWSRKAIQQILDKQGKKANRGKEAKDPQADFMGSRYISTDGWDGVPAGGMKGCLVNACRGVDGLPMTLAKRMIFVQGEGMTESGTELVRIHSKEGPVLYTHPVKIPSGADIRHRAMFKDWRIRLSIRYLANILSQEQVLNLLELAGFIEGLCEHRPGCPQNNTGNFGRFHILRNEDLAVAAK
jgi:hypothetical protein